MELETLRAELADTPSVRTEGRVRGVVGLGVQLVLPGGRIGDAVIIRRRGAPLLAEIVSFREGEAVALPLGDTVGVGPDDRVESTGGPLSVRVGTGLLGRVLDGLGRPIDGGPPPVDLVTAPIDRSPPAALARQPVTQAFPTGVRAIDGLLTLGVGQRIGLFSGSGVGKSTLLGSIARGAPTDVVVIVALVGERGREVTEFVAGALGPARARSVVVVATSDAPAIERLRAAQAATTIAEHFRDAGRRVLLLCDSITRVARAQREIGLAAGEPPTRRGYPPSVFAVLPRLLERSGQADRGSITAIYTVLVEGDDLDEPVADEARGILDGHIVLSRGLAGRHHHPAIDVSASVSRVMPRVTSPAQCRAAAVVRKLLATYEEKRDLVALGAVRAGADPGVDHALGAFPAIERFLVQTPDESSPYEATLAALHALAEPHH